MNLYRIKDWADIFEISDAKKIEGPLRWVATPTKHDGVGFRRIAAQRDKSDLFAAWHLMIQIAAKLPRAERGKLVDSNGTPLDAEALALKTGWPEAAFTRALTFFSDPKQGWLTVETIADQPAPPAAPSSNGGSAPAGSAEVHDGSKRVRSPSDDPGKSAEIRGNVLTTGQDRTGKETTSPCPTSAEPPSGGEKFVKWFLELLAEAEVKVTLTPSIRESWADCYDKMLRLDGRTKDEIKAVCRWARNDQFWRSNFLSPMKLRQKNDGGVMWFDVFHAKMTNPPQGGRAEATPKPGYVSETPTNLR